jgi:hypothetical protein
MFFKRKAPEKDKNAAANAAEVMGKRQHSVVEQVAASPPVPKGLRIQSTHRPASTPKARRKKTCRTRPRPRYRPSTPICGALKDGLRIPVLR